MTPEQFAAKLRLALPNGLRSVVLYGSAAAGDFLPGASRYDVLILADPLGVPQLDALSLPVLEWTAAGNPLPQMMTPAELSASTDAFPLELLDLQQSRKILWGSDPFAALVVESGDVRLQLERELKGKLLLLRERYLLAGRDPERLAELLTSSLSTFLVLIRGALRLYQPAVPATKIDDLRALARHIPFDPEPLLTVLRLKEGTLPRRGADLASLFRDYLAALERVVLAVDSHVDQASKENTP